MKRERKIVKRAAVSLCAALAITLTSISTSTPVSAIDSSSLSYHSIYTEAQESNFTSIPDKFWEDLSKSSNGGNLSIATFQSYAQTHRVPTEFVQQILSDKIVYRDQGKLLIESVNTKLPLNSYKRENFVRHADNDIDYYIDSNTKAAKGIDVSRYQGNIDWKKVKADGIDFAIIRVGNRGYSKGDIYEDEKWRQNVEGALAAGVQVGAYFYSQAISKAEAVEEAKFVLQRIKPYQLTMPVVFDIEEAGANGARTNYLTTQQRTDFTIAFCDTIAAAGYKPMVYTYTNMFYSKLDLSRLTKYEKWIAQYYQTPYFPYDYQMWQYSSTGRVNGIQGNVDMNLYFPKSLSSNSGSVGQTNGPKIIPIAASEKKEEEFVPKTIVINPLN